MLDGYFFPLGSDSTVVFCSEWPVVLVNSISYGSVGNLHYCLSTEPLGFRNKVYPYGSGIQNNNKSTPVSMSIFVFMKGLTEE